MATNTTNYGWTKPDYEDDADIKDLNDNFDAIDAQMKANENYISAIGNNGSKQLLKITASSQEINGVVYTVNTDGTITAVIPSGLSSNAQLELFSSAAPPENMRNRSLILSGSPSGGSSTTWRMTLQNTTSGYNTIVTNAEGDSDSFAIPSSITRIRLVFTVYANCPAQTITIKPMIRDAAIKDNTYQPYSPTNRELYEMILALQ